METGIELIAKERGRQIEEEGWTPEHDAQHNGRELWFAGICYMSDEKNREYIMPFAWPWEEKWWKPTPENRIKELVKAGALFQAQFDLTGEIHVLKFRDKAAEKIDEISNPTP